VINVQVISQVSFFSLILLYLFVPKFALLLNFVFTYTGYYFVSRYLAADAETMLRGAEYNH
jgi:hypothetical protein